MYKELANGWPVITSKENQYIKMARGLRNKKGRQDCDRFLLEGVRLCEEALAINYPLHFGLISPQLLEDERGLACAEACRKKGIQVFLVNESIFSFVSCTEHPQGILLVAEKKHYQLKDFPLYHKGFCLIADSLQDPGNTGTILRTAYAAGVGVVILAGLSVDIYNPKTVRASMGAVLRLPIIIVSGYDRAYQMVKKARMKVFLATADGEHIYSEENLNIPIAWVLGSEAKGAGIFWQKAADVTVSLPMAKGAESLNVSIAAGILLYETARQKGFPF